MVHVTSRTIRAWETSEVKSYALDRVGALDVLWKTPAPPAYEQRSDAALVSELSALVGVLGSRLAELADRLAGYEEMEREYRKMQEQNRGAKGPAESDNDVPPGETEFYNVRPTGEQSSPEPGSGSTQPGTRRIRGRGPRRA